MKQTTRRVSAHAQTFWKEYWLGLYATPRAWAHKGELLVHAFEAVADATVEGSMHLNMKDQALMLAGMAIEVQLKAIIVHTPNARRVVTLSKRPKDMAARSLWDAFYSHDLVNLATEAKVVLNQTRTETAARKLSSRMRQSASEICESPS